MLHPCLMAVLGRPLLSPRLASPPRTQVGLRHAEDDQAAGRAPLQRMIDNPDPIATAWREVLQPVQPEAEQPATHGLHAGRRYARIGGQPQEDTAVAGVGTDHADQAETHDRKRIDVLRKARRR